MGPEKTMMLVEVCETAWLPIAADIAKAANSRTWDTPKSILARELLSAYQRPFLVASGLDGLQASPVDLLERLWNIPTAFGLLEPHVLQYSFISNKPSAAVSGEVSHKSRVYLKHQQQLPGQEFVLRRSVSGLCMASRPDRPAARASSGCSSL